MKQPLQRILHCMKASAAIEDAASARATQLERFASDIMSCRVVVDVPQIHKRYGRPFGVRIGLTRPGHKLMVERREFKDIDVSFCEAFDNRERQLEDAVRLRCGDEKLYPCQWHGCLLRLTTSMGLIAPGRFRRARPRWSMNLDKLTVRKTHEGCLLQGQKRRCGEVPV